MDNSSEITFFYIRIPEEKRRSIRGITHTEPAVQRAESAISECECDGRSGRSKLCAAAAPITAGS